MFENLLEIRYPFSNCIEFFVGGYWLHLEGLHLSLGWLFIVFLTFRLVRENIPLSVKLSILFFSLVIFNNPAYDLSGLKLNELFGIVAIVLDIFLEKTPRIYIDSPVAGSIFLIFFIGIVHGLLVSIAYPELNVEFATVFTRIAIHLKVLVVVLNLKIVGSFLKKGVGFNTLIKYIVTAGTFATLMYLLQGFVLIGARTIPYGTFIDSGYLGFPSFGSTSFERGHFGKFMIPLFPFFLYAMLAWRWWWCLALFIFIFLINFSASGQAFFVSFVLIAFYKFTFILKRKFFLFFFIISTILAITLIAMYHQFFLGVIQKIYVLSIRGDQIGGRSFNLFLQYIDTYPLGIGYSGSTLRAAPGLPEINAGHFAFISQYSFVSPLVLGIYLFLTVKTLRATRHSGLLAKSMTVGVLGSSVIFLGDILWFVPTIWLSYLIAWYASKIDYVSPNQL